MMSHLESESLEVGSSLEAFSCHLLQTGATRPPPECFHWRGVPRMCQLLGKGKPQLNKHFQVNFFSHWFHTCYVGHRMKWMQPRSYLGISSLDLQNLSVCLRQWHICHLTNLTSHLLVNDIFLFCLEKTLNVIFSCNSLHLLLHHHQLILSFPLGIMPSLDMGSKKWLHSEIWY